MPRARTRPPNEKNRKTAEKLDVVFRIVGKDGIWEDPPDNDDLLGRYSIRKFTSPGQGLNRRNLATKEWRLAVLFPQDGVNPLTFITQDLS